MTKVTLTIQLSFPDIDTALRSVHELKAITGIDNNCFHLDADGQPVSFSPKDAYQVSVSSITADEYLTRHKE